MLHALPPPEPERRETDELPIARWYDDRRTQLGAAVLCVLIVIALWLWAVG